jgi:cytochrome c biogenesis protein CcdA
MNLEELAQSVSCEAARRNHRSAVMWLNLWNALVFVLGAAFVAMVVAALVLLIGGREVAAIIAGGGTVADGLATAFVVRQRNGMKKEQVAAWRDEQRLCGNDESGKRLLTNMGMRAD